VTPREWLRDEAAHDTTEGDCAQHVIDELARQRREIRALRRMVEVKDEGLRTAIKEFKRRGESPWLPMVECEASLNFTALARKVRK
jgi:hypothetical protein